MQLYQMITLIVVTALVIGLLKEWIKSKQVSPVDLTPLEARLDKLESLQQRVEILEAIVTDKGYDLKSEINNLR